MILALDIGNSNIVAGSLEDGRVLVSDRIITDRGQTTTDYAAALRRLLAIWKPETQDFSGAVVCSVVPTLTQVLCEASALITGREPIVVGPGMDTGLTIALDDPVSIGADLIATAVAAKARYPLPCAVIDMGTATTISVLDENGRFLGGPLLPGLGISLEALTARTSLLPSIRLYAPEHCIGSNTEDCIRAGTVFGYAGALDGLLDRIAAELGHPITATATGGLARTVVPWCVHTIELDDDLLLRGLWLLWERSQKNIDR